MAQRAGEAGPGGERPGLWRALAVRAGRTTGPGAGGLYRGLAARTVVPRANGRLWRTLDERVDPARYRPQRAADVTAEEQDEAGRRVTVLRSPSGRYLRLNAEEAELWTLMDGTKSVEQLATHGFLRFGQLLPVAGLVAALRAAGCLSDQPVGLYAGLRERTAGLVEGWSRRFVRALRQREFAVDGLDGALAALYRGGGWLLFTAPARLIIALVVLAGLTSFGLLAANGSYRLLDPGNAAASLLVFWLALLLSFLFHELAHGLAVKHYGRVVPRGGVMIYYGMPAAFVDTSDIWLAGPRARIVTSLVGPICDLVVGSLAALVALLLEGNPLGGAAYALAAAAYLAALCNLNPLLELDGYYMLSDRLGLPNLRREALAFIGGPLWQKLRARAALSDEERIFAVYGLCAAAYTALAVVLALLFWRAQLAGALGTLWAQGPAGRLLALLLTLAVVAPLGLGLLVAAWGLVRRAAASLHRRGYGRSPLLVAAALAALALALTTLPLRYGPTAEVRLIAPLLWLLALVAQLGLRDDYRGAALARSLDCFLAVTALAVLALVGAAVAPDLAQVWSGVEGLGFSLLLLAGFVALLDLDLRQAASGELLGTALLMVLAFLAGGLTIGLLQADSPGWTLPAYVLAAAPVYASLMALALLLPQVAALQGSRLIWSWLLLWAGIVTQTTAFVLELLAATRGSAVALAAAVLAAGLWAAAWCSHAVALRQPSRRELRWPLEPAHDEAERLRRAFRHSYAGLYRSLKAHLGPRRARALDDRMDVLAATANWQVTLDREQARVGAELATAPLEAQGARYAEVLHATVTTIEELAGATFARRAIQATYDALPWPEREAADRRCFPNTPWARLRRRRF